MKRVALWVAAALALTACATPLQMVDIIDIKDKPAAAAKGGTAFTQALFAEYKALTVDASDGRGRWKDAAIYADKGLQAFDGKDVLPELVVKVTPAATSRCTYLCVSKPEESVEWTIPEQSAGDLVAARARLMAELTAGAATRSPRIAARAQVMFDCWLVETRDGQPSSDCKGRFIEAEAELTR